MAIERTLDWRPNPDPRSRLYGIALMDCYATGSTRANIMRRKTVWLDQGSEGACTGFGAAHVMASSPHPKPMTNGDAQQFYYRARFWDEWEGEDYEGSSVNGAMKALREANRIYAWRWVNSTAELRHALSWHGPVEAGTWWYGPMWEPDHDGYVRVSGEPVGGHAYEIAGFETRDGLYRYRLENSWGRDWGHEGGAWVREEDMAALIAAEGEFAVPVKV